MSEIALGEEEDAWKQLENHLNGQIIDTFVIPLNKMQSKIDATILAPDLPSALKTNLLSVQLEIKSLSMQIADITDTLPNQTNSDLKSKSRTFNIKEELSQVIKIIKQVRRQDSKIAISTSFANINNDTELLGEADRMN